VRVSREGAAARLCNTPIDGDRVFVLHDGVIMAGNLITLDVRKREQWRRFLDTTNLLVSRERP
jgi:hypothetical protein